LNNPRKKYTNNSIRRSNDPITFQNAPSATTRATISSSVRSETMPTKQLTSVYSSASITCRRLHDTDSPKNCVICGHVGVGLGAALADWHRVVRFFLSHGAKHRRPLTHLTSSLQRTPTNIRIKHLARNWDHWATFLVLTV